jgi:hypothetical protein
MEKEINITMIKCTTCEKFLPKEKFHKKTQNKNGYSYKCRRCTSEYGKRNRNSDPNFAEKHKLRGQKWYTENKEDKLLKNKEWRENNISKYREINLKSRFGINNTQYEEMLNLQSNSCSICKKHKDEFTYHLVVDHCHVTGKIRGLLCKKCNLGIGHLNDDITILENSIEYLKKHKNK